ncbi:choice-of-anchor Q domain-containing protein [Chloroflexota bacterium]
MRRKQAILVLTLCALILPAERGTLALTRGDVLYVKPGASGGCTSWADACELQTALAGAEAGYDIWVAKGTYRPTTGADRAATFQLVSGVGVYGGFTGSETSRDSRGHWFEHATILSGDLNRDDGPDLFANYDDNSYHVVNGSGVSGTAVLNGFWIIAGNANGSHINDTDRGGGMFVGGGSPTVESVFIAYNRGFYGGGMFNDESNPTLVDCGFEDNSSLAGGGMYNHKSNPSLEDVYFWGNVASSGAGMFNHMSRPELVDVAIRYNNAGNEGGGMFNSQSSPGLKLVDSGQNSAVNNGGGMFNANESSPSLSDVWFWENMADWGGGMYNSGENSLLIVRTTFRDNEAEFGGGGMYNNESDPALGNAVFLNNAAYYGGGVYNYWSDPVFSNCTFRGNSADFLGAGMYNTFHSNPNVDNSIMWPGPGGVLGTDAVDQIYDGPNSNTQVRYSDVLNWTGGDNNIEAEPRFVDGSNPRLQPTSPAIDAGDNRLVFPGTTTDRDGLPRFADIAAVPDTGYGDPGVVDMGAYEVRNRAYLPLVVR